MATLLAGESSLHNYAPPSHGQVLAMCQHLESLIRDVQTQTAELRRDYGHADNTIGTLKAQLGETKNGYQHLQDGQHAMAVSVDSLKKDLGRTSAKIGRLGSGLESLQEDISSCREASKVANAHFNVTKQDVGHLQDRVNAIQVQLEKEQASDNSYLKEQIGLAGAAVRDLRQDHEKTKGHLQDHAQAIRATNTSIQRVSDELSRTNTHANMLETRIGEQVQGLKHTKQHLAETNTVALKLHEEHKGTKASLSVTQEAVKKVNVHVKQVNDALDSTSQRVLNNHELLSRTTAGLGEARDTLERTRVQVSTLDHAQQVLTAQTATLQDALEDTTANLHLVKASLKETNSIVLPNLRLDTGRPWSMQSLERDRNSPGSRNGKKVPGGMTPRNASAFDSREEMPATRMDSGF